MTKHKARLIERTGPIRLVYECLALLFATTAAPAAAQNSITPSMTGLTAFLALRRRG